jgi:hypothetical protein
MPVVVWNHNVDVAPHIEPDHMRLGKAHASAVFSAFLPNTSMDDVLMSGGGARGRNINNPTKGETSAYASPVSVTICFTSKLNTSKSESKSFDTLFHYFNSAQYACCRVQIPAP